MQLFGYILLFSILSGVLSIAGGVGLLFRASWVRRFSMHFLSFAIGALLATAFLDLLPEALELAPGNAENIFVASLAGVVGFFVLESLILRFHPHHHDDEELHHHATPNLLLIGDSVHNF
ncbi:MAG: ZIP family metal transporter, partial [bacterium]|nr:ZIP family metal transporter [bacterium]